VEDGASQHCVVGNTEQVEVGLDGISLIEPVAFHSLSVFRKFLDTTLALHYKSWNKRLAGQ
jgi:hypothetical protein